MTITGTNDEPTITVRGPNALGAVTEDARCVGDTVGHGTIAFNDIDLIDVHTTTLRRTPATRWAAR